MSNSRESMECDVLIVGAGPAGLSASIRLAQKNSDLNICVIDKSETIGGHSLSGAVLDPKALKELIPDWENAPPSLFTPATEDQFLYLNRKRAWRLPTPPQMKNKGHMIISLSEFCRWLSEHAEQLGVNLLPSFAATEMIYEHNQVKGVITGDKGVDRFGQPKSDYQQGYALYAKQVILAEGCRGSLTQTIFDRFDLRRGVNPQTYGLGIKEVWEMPENTHQAGKVIHTIGWPLDNSTYGGSFVYYFGKNLLAIGFVVGLDYTNPYLNPYEEFQRFKTHPAISLLLKNAKRIAYGARALIEGGLQSIPKLTFPGGLIIGDAAGFLNVPKIKGIHNAMKSGMVAADALYPMLQENLKTECETYPNQLKNSWVYQELYKARNIRPAFRNGLWAGLSYAAIDTYLFRGHAPWTFQYKEPDHATLKKKNQCKKLIYPKHDQTLTFDLSSSVYLSNIHYEENQPYHLKLKNREAPITINLKEYDAPEQRYCPAGVYEIVYSDNQAKLHINGGNCIHCKACDIKDPTQNIVWTPSEGGSGPQYEIM